MVDTSCRGPLRNYLEDVGSATTVAIVTIDQGILLMSGFDITIPGYWRNSRKTEQYSKEGW